MIIRVIALIGERTEVSSDVIWDGDAFPNVAQFNTEMANHHGLVTVSGGCFYYDRELATMISLEPIHGEHEKIDHCDVKENNATVFTSLYNSKLLPIDIVCHNCSTNVTTMFSGNDEHPENYSGMCSACGCVFVGRPLQCNCGFSFLESKNHIRCPACGSEPSLIK